MRRITINIDPDHILSTQTIQKLLPLLKHPYIPNKKHLSILHEIKDASTVIHTDINDSLEYIRDDVYDKIFNNTLTPTPLRAEDLSSDNLRFDQKVFELFGDNPGDVLQKKLQFLPDIWQENIKQEYNLTTEEFITPQPKRIIRTIVDNALLDYKDQIVIPAIINDYQSNPNNQFEHSLIEFEDLDEETPCFKIVIKYVNGQIQFQQEDF